MTGLTPKQRKFVEEYVLCDNGTEAAIRAGYSPKSARKMASQLLDIPGLSDAVAEKRRRLEVKTEITSAQVLEELGRIAFSDVGDVLDFSGAEPRLRAANEIPLRARRAIQSVKVKRYIEGHGESAKEVEVVEFKFWSKDAALEKLGKRFGLWKDGEADPEQLTALLELLSRRKAVANGNGHGRREYDA